MDNNEPTTDNDDDETDHGTIYYPDLDHDLLVLEDEGIWENLPDDHKFTSNTSSLSFASTFEGNHVNILDLGASPEQTWQTPPQSSIF